LQRALIGEGAALGALGSLLGVILGVLLRGRDAAAADRRSRQRPTARVGASLRARRLAAARVFLDRGSWWRASAPGCRRAPPRARRRRARSRAATAITAGSHQVRLARAWRCCSRAVLARLPAGRGLPLFGYAAIAALLFGACCWCRR
jgi:hypothetical protein